MHIKATNNTADNPRRILIIDDEPNIAMAIQFVLEGAGYETASANHGNQGLALLESFRPDLLLLDVMMPGIDGFSLAKTIRKSEYLQQVPIIFITAKGTPDDKIEGYDAGAESYIVKPFDNDVLLQKVEDALLIKIY